MAARDKTPPTKAAELNRARRLQTIRGLENLLRVATAPGFRGTIGVEISAKDSRLGVPKFTEVRFGLGED